MGFLNKIFKKNDTVYIAYDREDENIALSVCEVLEYNGLTCWLKSRDSFGNDVSEVIKAIRDSGLCVVIYSENSKDSRFVANEVDTAFSESVPLCVFKTDPAPIKGSLEFFLSRAPRIEAHPDYKNHLQSLTRACLKSLEKSTNNIRIPENYKTKSPHDVFISYSTKDRDLAEIIRETLEDNAIKCWIAPRDIEPGKSYAKQIMSAVKDAKLHFCLFTENFQASKFTNNELEIAFSAKIPIVSLKADESFPEDKCEFYLRTANWIDGSKDLDYALAESIIQVTQLLDSRRVTSKKKTENQTTHDIFISYHSRDLDVADELCEILESSGFKCWIAPRDIKTSENYASDILDGLNASSIFLPIFSRNYQESEYTKEEMKYAFSDEKPILPLRLNSYPEGEFRFYLSSVQWVDGEKDLKSGYESIIQKVAEILGKPIVDDEITSKQNPDLMLSAISNTVVCGNVIALSGSLKIGEEAISRAGVDIYKDGDLVDTVVTSKAGKFSLLIPTADIETLEFKAIFKENDLYYGCESVSVSIDVVGDEPVEEPQETLLRAYEGDEPYIFVSYSHKDSIEVLGEIERFQRMGYNIWYDEGFTPGGEWLDEIAEAILNSSAFIAFTSQNSAASTDVRNEINLALNKQIPIINIYLEKTELPLRLELKLGDALSVLKYNLSNDEFMLSCIRAFKEFGIESNKKDKIDEFLATFNEEEDDDDITFKNDETIPHVDETPFPAYDGEDAYAFVSYSHKDYEFVFNEIDRFNKQGLNIWYDEGIAPGNEWLAEIGRALFGASLFIVFISENSVSSKFVRKEITYAITKDIPFVAIHIEKTQLPVQLDLALSDLQAILQYGMNDEEYYRRYTKAFNIHLKNHGIRLKRVDEIE